MQSSSMSSDHIGVAVRLDATIGDGADIGIWPYDDDDDDDS